MNYTLLYQKPETLEQLTTVQGNSGFSFNNFAKFRGLWSWFDVRNACEQWVFSLPYKARSVHFNRDIGYTSHLWWFSVTLPQKIL